jgi:hypothetical protein
MSSCHQAVMVFRDVSFSAEIKEKYWFHQRRVQLVDWSMSVIWVSGNWATLIRKCEQTTTVTFLSLRWMKEKQRWFYLQVHIIYKQSLTDNGASLSDRCRTRVKLFPHANFGVQSNLHKGKITLFLHCINVSVALLWFTQLNWFDSLRYLKCTFYMAQDWWSFTAVHVWFNVLIHGNTFRALGLCNS